jgi:hypothetical protein
MTVYHTNVTTLHITNGSCAGDKLQTFVDGQVVLAHDVLHEGPAPRVDGDAWHAMRARFLADTYEPNVDEIRADLVRVDRTIAGAAGHDDIVLWFEHDLFDQLQLIRTLDLLVRLKADATYIEDVASCREDMASCREDVASGFSRTVSLICIDRFPGVERFIGLGQLDAAQLASLYPSRHPVTAGQFALASAAWDAFRSPDPNELMRIARDASDLPFLGDALLRLIAEYPSLDNGLSRTETLALTGLRDGPLKAGALFVASQRHEPRPFMGDLPFYDILRGLAVARVPLLTIEGAAEQIDLRLHTVAITAAGRDVLAGRLDHVAVNGIDRWKGGVHLVGSDRSRWRWDARGERLVS